MSEVVRPEGWHNWQPGREKTSRYAEFNSTGPGASLSARVPWARSLTEEQAKAMTVEAVLKGQDGWNPKAAATIGVQSPVRMSGTWRFALDRSDVGVSEQWFTRDLADRIELPGALQHQGYGDEIATNTPWVAKLIDLKWSAKEKYKRYTQPGNVLVPFFLQPARHYLGAAWYQRDIEIQEFWKGQRVVLTLERPHWETRVWVDERPIGSNRSLGTPHVYDLGTGLTPGRHRLTIRVDNRMIVDVGSDAHSVSDETQTSWNGIVGRMELSETSLV
jgi:hypothetical protein